MKKAVDPRQGRMAHELIVALLALAGAEQLGVASRIERLALAADEDAADGRILERPVPGLPSVWTAGPGVVLLGAIERQDGDAVLEPPQHGWAIFRKLFSQVFLPNCWP